MRIAIDARSMVEEAPSGVGFYTSELTRALLQQNSSHEFVFFSVSAKEPAYPTWLRRSNVEIIHHSIPSKLFHSLQWVHGRPFLDRIAGGCDLLWMPNLHFASWSPDVRSILTVHDLSFVRYPEFFSRKDRLWHNMIRARRTVDRADSIVAVSEHTKQELMSLWNVKPEKIRVMHLGVNAEEWMVKHEDLARMRRDYEIFDPYMLFVGNVEPRKNIVSLLQAYMRLRSRRDDIPDLLLVGKKDAKAEQLESWIQQLGFGDCVRFLGYVPAEDRAPLYAGAEMFVYPSIYEGFGLPPLEAMAAGTPVITTPVSSLSEVCEDAAVYVNPYKITEIASGIEKLWDDREYQQNLIEKGRKRVRELTWTRTAEQMLELFG